MSQPATSAVAARSHTVLRAEDVRYGNTAIRVGPEAQEPAPQVDVRSDGGVIREIHVTCACGRELVLDCDTQNG